MSDTRVYFVKSARSNAIKIGVAENVQQRLSSLQTGSIARLELLAEMPGDERYERVLHETFAEYRIRGEWFRLDGRLAAFVSMLPAMYALKTKAPKVRNRPAPSKPDPALQQHIENTLYPAIRDAVLAFGVDRFSVLVGARRGGVARAMWRRGHRFSIDWFMVLLAVVDENTRLKLANLFLEPMGLEARTRAEIAAQEEERVRLQQLKDGILTVLGPIDGRAFIEEHEREVTAENARRLAANDAAATAGVQ